LYNWISFFVEQGWAKTGSVGW